MEGKCYCCDELEQNWDQLVYDNPTEEIPLDAQKIYPTGPLG